MTNRDYRPSEQGQPEEPKKPSAKGSDAVSQEQERLSQALMRYLESRGKEDPTSYLDEERRPAIPTAFALPFGTKFGATNHYVLLPASAAQTGITPDTPHWRIELHGLAVGAAPLGLDIVGDVVVGRNVEGQNPADLDLTPFRAAENGVSRRHALLRPTRNHLYILDLGSTNGTMHNAMPLGTGFARAIRNNDLLTFGRLSCTVKLIDGPGLHQDEKVEVVEARLLDVDAHKSKPVGGKEGETRPMDPDRELDDPQSGEAYRPGL